MAKVGVAAHRPLPSTPQNAAQFHSRVLEAPRARAARPPALKKSCTNHRSWVQLLRRYLYYAAIRAQTGSRRKKYDGPGSAVEAAELAKKKKKKPPQP